MPSRKSLKEQGKAKDNFSGQLEERSIGNEDLKPIRDESDEPSTQEEALAKVIEKRNTPHVNLDKLAEGTVGDRVASVNQTFVIRPELKELLDELVFLPGSRKRRPGTKGLLSDISNDGMARELYRRELITKNQMNSIIIKSKQQILHINNIHTYINIYIYIYIHMISNQYKKCIKIICNFFVKQYNSCC